MIGQHISNYLNYKLNCKFSSTLKNMTAVPQDKYK